MSATCWAGLSLAPPRLNGHICSTAPALVGYDPKIVPVWTSLSAPAFGVLRLKAWRLRVFLGAVLMGQGGKVLTWQG